MSLDDLMESAPNRQNRSFPARPPQAEFLPEPPKPEQPPFGAIQQTQPPSDVGPWFEFTVGWLFPVFSPTFYYYVGRRPLWRALLFFLIFITLQNALVIAGMAVILGPLRTIINEDFPEVTIADGRATVHGDEPAVIDMSDLGTGLWVVDTTGEYTVEDVSAGRYSYVLLLTETEFVQYDDVVEEASVISLSDLQAAFYDAPIEINARTVNQWIDYLLLFVLIILELFFVFGWLIYIVLAGLILWGITVLVRRGTTFGHIVKAGLYAVVPAFYGYVILANLPQYVNPALAFPMTWLIHGAVWIVGLVCMLYPRDANTLPGILALRPVRQWRMLIALPFLAALHLEWVFGSLPWYVMLPVAVVTVAVLLGVNLRAILRQADLIAPDQSLGFESVSSQYAPMPQAVQAAQPSSIQLWMPDRAAFLGLVIFIPALFAYYIINVVRMGMRNKVWKYVAAAIVWELVEDVLAIFNLPWSVYAFIVHPIFGYFIKHQMESDIAAFRSNHPEIQVEKPGLASGFFIGLGAVALSLICAFAFSFMVELVRSLASQ